MVSLADTARTTPFEAEIENTKHAERQAERDRASGRGTGQRRLSDSDVDRQDAFSFCEVSALARYVSDHGLDPKAEILAPLYAAMNHYRNAETSADRALAREEIMPLYAKLTALTYGAAHVNGSTVVASGRVLRHLAILIAVGTGFFLAAILIGYWEIHLHAEFTKMVAGAKRAAIDYGMSEAAAEATALEAFVLLEILGLGREEWSFIIAFLNPFVWGGLGASIFLLKQLSDSAQDFTFDHRRLQGVNTRIFLGAVFAAVLTNLFVPMEDITAGGFKIGPSALAFLTGLGTKVIYGAFERVIDSIHAKLAGPQEVANGKTGTA